MTSSFYLQKNLQKCTFVKPIHIIILRRERESNTLNRAGQGKAIGEIYSPGD